MSKSQPAYTPRGKQDRHMEALEARGIANRYKGHFTFLYQALSILDGKASSLLTFNAIGLAALTIWLEKTPINPFHLTLDLAFVSFLISGAICLSIVKIFWVSTRMLRKDEKRPTFLLKLRNARTKRYRWAWLFAILALAITGLATLHHVTETVAVIYFRWLYEMPNFYSPPDTLCACVANK